MKLNNRQVVFFKRELKKWWVDNKRDFPWRNTKDPYKIILAEFLLQKTAAYKVKYVYQTIINLYPSAKELAIIDLHDLETIIKPLGLASRSKRLIELVNTIECKYKGLPPKNRKLLEQLPGVGKYTSLAVLCYAYGQRFLPIDSNVIRIFKRYFDIDIDPIKTDDSSLDLESLLPFKRIKEFNWALMDFSALVCTFKKPKCLSCPLQKKCRQSNVVNF